MARIDAFLRLMIEQKASDLHFIAGGEPVLRVYGDLIPVQYRKITSDECLNLIEEILPSHLADAFARYMDVNFAYQLENSARFRVSLFKHTRGIGITFHMIPLQNPSFETLNLPRQVEQFAALDHGLVLVCGAAGSGKSSTLAAMIETINQNQARHIVTLENPIEFVFKRKKSLISQREIGTHSRDYFSALKNALVGSADVILAGDLKNSDDISLALSAADAKTLVFATLPATTAAAAIPRIIDVFPAGRQPHIRSMLSVTLRGVIHQQLVKQSRVRERLPVTEVLFGSPELSRLIRAGKIHEIDACLEKADPEKNISRDVCLSNLLKKELISLETAIAAAKDPGTFQMTAV